MKNDISTCRETSHQDTVTTLLNTNDPMTTPNLPAANFAQSAPIEPRQLRRFEANYGIGRYNHCGLVPTIHTHNTVSWSQIVCAGDNGTVACHCGCCSYVKQSRSPSLQHEIAYMLRKLSNNHAALSTQNLTNQPCLILQKQRKDNNDMPCLQCTKKPIHLELKYIEIHMRS
jgi:hypothetical protein